MRCDGHTAQLQPPLEYRQVGVKPFGRQQGAAGRTGDAYHALNFQALGDRFLRQCLQVGALLLVVGPGERRQLLGTGRPAIAGPGQHLGHQAAA